ncbi:MAG TPA: amidase [Woeseiaceae bacterium]|nr:amidase [Woeseiaceae bacterium]
MTRRSALARLAALAATSALPRRMPAATAPSDPLAGTIAHYLAGLDAGEWTATEITALALERCAAHGAAWRAIDVLDPDGALAAAREADARRRGDRRLGPLDGVPVFAKSIHDMRGLPTTASNAEWARLFPEAVARDAIEVARLRAGGAIVLGKAAADDFAYRGNGTSSHTGQVLNPYDPGGTRTPGGSSAGAAVAVAGALAFAALGTDDGGSNRIPAQFTGVVGMKPTFGLVPRTGVIPTWPYLDTHGPLARTVADAARLLAVIAGADPADPFSLDGAADLPALHDDALDGARLGLVEAHVPRAAMTAEALATWDRAVADLRAAGAVVVPFTPAVTLHTVQEAFADAATERGDVPPNPKSAAPTASALYRYFEGRSDDPRAAIRRGYRAYRAFYDVLPASYEDCEPLFEKHMTDDAAAQSFARSRAAVLQALADSMHTQRVQAMVYPTMPFNAPRAVDSWPDVRTPLGYGNWLGLPEVSVPAGYGSDGLPALNLSIVGLPGEDAQVLALAHAFERQAPRFRTPPRPT